MLEYIKWWYGAGWAGAARAAGRRLEELADLFSVSILLQTLFSPWKRIITYPGAGLDAHMRAMLDNLVSRIIGFFVRIFVLIAAVVSVVILAIISAIQLAAWPLLPIAGVVLIVMGLMS